MTEKSPNKTTSFFEFWPGWVMYIPVIIQWIGLAIYHRSITLPFLANPSLRLSGMAGVGKSELMVHATGKAKETILPWIKYHRESIDPKIEAKICLEKAKEQGIEIPFVCKPDIACRGLGLKLVDSEEKLIDVIAHYPHSAAMVVQKLADYEPEVGIFYVRDPETGKVEIPSMTQKILPRVTGDGVKTLGQLIEDDERAGAVKFLYEKRHKDRWDWVPEKDEQVRLVFSASHSKGSIFKDVRHLVTPELTTAIDEIMQGLPDFYYGRADVKFKDIESLQKGKTLQIVEINGASAESIHIWDKDASFKEAVRALMWQYRTLFELGAYHRKQGHKTPKLSDFIHGWLTERRLNRFYPHTD